MLCDKVINGINALQERIGEKEWKSYSRSSFIYNLGATVEELEEITSFLELMETEFKSKALEGAPDLSENINELNKLIVLLKRNQKLEETTVKGARERGLQELIEEVEKPDLYADLEQKVLGVLLKTRYLIERIHVFLRKQQLKPLTTESAARDVITLLEQKEEELQKVKEKYEELRAKSFMGVLEEGTASDIENELNEIARQLESESTILKRNLSDYKKLVEAAISSQADLERKIDDVEELNSQHLAKTFELITLLKKERDYAKKIVMDIEHETLQLRSAYSKELLALEEEKEKARNRAYEKFKKQLVKLQGDLHEKNELITHFRTIIADKEKKVNVLKEKLEKEGEKRSKLKERQKRKKVKGKRKGKGKKVKGKKK